MYANPAREHERIELEKARLELEQQKAELAATRAETRAQSQEAITDMADAGSRANQQSRAKVTLLINDYTFPMAMEKSKHAPGRKTPGWYAYYQPKREEDDDEE